MLLKYDLEFDREVVIANLKRLTNQIYKLLPSREEGLDWEKPLETVMEELAGMARLFAMYHKDLFFPLVCKLEGLFALADGTDFLLFRRTIFEALGIMSDLIKSCQD